MPFLQAEMEGKYAATVLLSSHKKEAAAALKRLQEQYEARLREKQMDLNAAMCKLQVIDISLPPRMSFCSIFAFGFASSACRLVCLSSAVPEPGCSNA